MGLYSYNMKRGPLITAIILFVAVAVIVAWPVVRIAASLDRGQQSARTSFAEIRRIAINEASSPLSITKETWKSQALDAWRTQDSMLALVIKESDGKVLYAMPASSPYYQQDPAGLSYVSPQASTTLFTGALSAGLSIEALYVTLSQESLFLPVRDATLVLLALTAALISGLILASNQGYSKPARLRETSVSPAQPGIPASVGSLYAEEPFEPSIESLSIGDDIYSGPALHLDTPKVEPAMIGFPRTGNLRPADLPEGILDGPRGLFDPESGLGWEAYLRDRLSAELRRSASFEQDLSFLICSLDGAKRGEEEFNLFATSVRDFFSFKDMAFLFGSDCTASMLPNMDVDHALRMSGELMKKLMFMFQSRKSADGGPGIHMGLTSRAGRLVDADRLIGEAMAAIGKARTDGGSRIMAFRPDPEKFRAYLAGQ
jgi:GGDEF domain-containing protein